jgi:hypothetical protein
MYLYLMPLPPGANSQTNMIPGKSGMNTITASNGRSYSPTFVEWSHSVKVIGPNASFTITGSEQYANSRWLLQSTYICSDIAKSWNL